MNIWKHGKYMDTWSIVHFLSGFLLAEIFYKFGYTFLSALLISTVLLLMWEGFEWLIKIIEPSANVYMDIVFGLLGFSLGAYIHYFLGKPFIAVQFLTVLSVTFLLALWGFIDFSKRGYR